MEMFWFIPSHGDGRYLGTSVGGRVNSLDYLKQIAQAIDHLGFRGACCRPASLARMLGSWPRP